MNLGQETGIGFVELSLLFFFTLFVALVLRLVLSRSPKWREAARIPLLEEPTGELRTEARGSAVHSEESIRAADGADAASGDRKNGGQNHA